MSSNRQRQQHHNHLLMFVVLVCIYIASGITSVRGFTLSSPPVVASFASAIANLIPKKEQQQQQQQHGTITTTTITTDTDTEPIVLSSVVTRVAVAGATGRTGQIVVQELLNRGVSEVVAIVRDQQKASTIFGNSTKIPTNLKIVLCDYTDEQQVRTALRGCDAAIWCATGFADTTSTTTTTTTDPPIIEKLKRLFGLTTTPSATPLSSQPQRSIDVIGLPTIAKVLVENQKRQQELKLLSSKVVENDKNNVVVLPKLVMCSSAGVTRPNWSEQKKVQYPGAADIPIVRLNPFNILQRKLESENAIRAMSNITYTILRPCGLNDNWPSNSRPLFTQGDVAVGRCSRYDVATVLVDLLTTPQAVQKTFEMVCIAGYPPATSIGQAIERLQVDSILSPDTTNYYNDATATEISYQIMQQLLPGEKQNSAALAMGQTYEQLDTDTTGRLGVRGNEDLSKIGSV